MLVIDNAGCGIADASEVYECAVCMCMPLPRLGALARPLVGIMFDLRQGIHVP